MTTPNDVLDFWLGEPADSDEALLGKMRRWFMDGSAMDAQIRERFGTTVEAALAGELDGWAETPRGRLALVLVLDQFTRHCFRGDARTYAGDAKAQALALEAFDRALDADLTPVERSFLLMPLHHSEDLAHHRRALALVRGRASETPRLLAEAQLEQSQKYHDVIARFGRFPHRNSILGRESTPEERTFLAEWPDRAPPRAARELQSAGGR